MTGAAAGEDPDRFIELGRFDWFATKTWRKLHAVRDEDWTDEHRADMLAWGVWHPVRLACGRTASQVFIPGPFTRMGAPRCTGCCRALGYPAGSGSPKNDDAVRPLLGLD